MRSSAEIVGSRAPRSLDAAGAGLWLAESIPGLPTVANAALRAAFEVDDEAALRSVHGRATLRWPQAANVILKRYARGVWLDSWREWRTRGTVRSFARREAENLEELARLGLPTPRALGWCGWDGWRGVLRPSALWMERVEHHGGLREELARDPGAAARWCDELARASARLHNAHWRHRDFYLQHWLVGAHGLVLIDVGRCEREPGMRERWFVKDLAALELSCPPNVSARTRLRFAARYFEQRNIVGRARRRAFVAAVRAKALRLGAHQPRHVDPREFATPARTQA